MPDHGSVSTRRVADGPSAWLAANLAALPPAVQAAVLAVDSAVPTRLGQAGGPEIKGGDGHWLAVIAAEPRPAAAAFAEALLRSAAPANVIAVGLGLGHVLDELEVRAAAVRVLLIEPVPGIARALLTRRDWTPWLRSGRLTLLVGPDYAGGNDAWRTLADADAEPRTFVHPVLERACPDRVAAALAVAGQIVTGARANAEARRQFAGRYLTQTLANLPVIATEGDVAELAGLAAGMPAVVVGAGPSLDWRLDLLREVAGRAVVIAVDTATRPLLTAGLRPHLVVGVDPSDANAAHLRDLGDRRGMWLVGEPSLHPSVFPAFAGRTFTFAVSDHDPWPWLADHHVWRGRLRAWGSVLTTAFDLACHLGCGPIVFLGADLAYSRGLQYCRNTTYEPGWRDCPDDAARAARFQHYLATHPHGPAPDVDGREVLTASHFLQFRDWIVARATEWVAGGTDRAVLNAGGAGILHGGAIEIVDPAAARARVTTGRAVGELDARLHAAHARVVSRREAVIAHLARAVADPGTLAIDRWAAFASGTHSRDDVIAAVTGAGTALRVLDLEAQRLRRGRAVWDRLQTESEARAAVHPDYDFASAQAEAQVAFALDDWRLRVQVPARSAVEDARTAAPWPTRVLDVGCGLGRTMQPFAARGWRVDGADHSGRMLSWAAMVPALASSRFYETSGADLGAAPDGAYDLVTMFHALHRVRPRAIRRRLLAAMARALGDGGVLHLQLPFFPGRLAATVPAPHVAWTWDAAPDSDLEVAHEGGDVWLTPDTLPEVFADVAAVCFDVRLQVVDFTSGTRRFDDGTERLAHLIVSGAASPTLAARVYAVS